MVEMTEIEADFQVDTYPALMCTALLFGDQFSIDWIEALSGLKISQILELLDEGIQKSELVIVRPGIYRVKGVRQMERRYGGISEEGKALLHRKIAAVLIKEMSGEGQTARAVSRHLLPLTDIGFEECRWLVKAGDDFAGTAQENDAQACYLKAINAIRGSQSESGERLFVKTVGRLGNFTRIAADLDWLIEIMRLALKKASGMKDQTTKALIAIQLANKYWLKSEYAASTRYFKQAWRIAERLDQLELLRVISVYSVFYYYWRGRFKQAIQVYEKYARDIDQFSNHSAPLSASIAIAYSYANIGKVNQGVGMFQALHDHCVKIGLHRIAASGELILCDILISARRIDDAYRILISKKSSVIKKFPISFQRDINLLQAYVLYRKGDLRKSVDYLTRALKLDEESQAANNPFSSFGYMLRLSWDMALERYPRVEGLDLEWEIQRAINSPSLVFQGTGYRYMAMMKSRCNAPSADVLELLKRSARLLQQSGHELSLARTRIEIARIHLKSGNRKRAKEVANKAAATIMAQNGLPFPDDLAFLIGSHENQGGLLDRMIQLSQEMVMVGRRRDVIRQIILTVIRITGAERGAIFQIDRSTRPWGFVLKAAKNVTVEEIGRPVFRESMLAISESAQSGNVVIRQVKDRRSSFNTASEILSCICVPMFLRGAIVGVLYFDNRWFASVFSKEKHPIFSYFAAQAAIAIENADAHEEILRLKTQLMDRKRYDEEPSLEIPDSESFVGQSDTVKQMLRQVKRVAATDTTVLITGETGVGKELIASLLVQYSRRADSPFIRVNCSAFPETLIASELFGYEKGAFTGADETRAGRFELADGGTLFLDEIGDVGMEIQVWLLRVLQSGEFERVGGRRTIRSDFRLIAATHQRLDLLAQEGRFRKDLFYRLNVFPIHVPPLRERKEDIPLLIHFFIGKFCRKMGRMQLKIRKMDVQKMVDYPWPGNVRELEHAIEQGVIMSTGNVFAFPQIGSHPFSHQGLANETMATLSDNEKQHILRALTLCRWKVSGPGGAAEVLGINPSTLTSKIRKLGLRREQGQGSIN